MENKLGRIIFDAPLFGKKRSPKNECDFGDEQTVGLKLKRSGKSFNSLGDHDYGVFLGENDGQFHVGTMEILSFTPSKLESFDTLEKLKQQWILD